MTTLITGATGFIGSAIARKLLETGHKVRALVRTQSDRSNLEGLADLEIVVGDLRNVQSLESALRGCDALFHAAADYRLWTPDPEALFETNVTGTRNIMLAAQRADIKRIVYTSSVATLGLNANATPADEQTPVNIDDMVGPYKRSKYIAEEEVRRLASEAQLPVVIVNPSAPVGPRDIKPTPTGRMIVDAAAGRMPGYVDTGLNIVHVDDVAAGHVLAFQRGRRGERYILGGTNLTLREIFHEVAALAGSSPPKIRLPHGIVLPMAYVAESWARLSGREPRMTVDGVRLARKHMYFRSDKAIRELGFSARPASEALRDAVAWFRANGYC